MNQTDTDLALAEICARWHDLALSSRPEKIWIARHLPMVEVNERITTDLDGAWFFDGFACQPRPPLDFVRFIAVQSGRFWHSGACPAPTSVFGSRRHEIGLAYFTEDLSKAQIYIEVIFGGLHGAGVLYSRTLNGLQPESTLWRS